MKKRYLLVLVLLIGLITITGCNKKDLTDAEKFKKEYGENFLVYNAFIMPFDSAFDKHSFSAPMINAAVAVSEWKHNEHHYEWIQGILVDTKFLMKAESRIHENIRGLASCIATGSDF